MNVKKTFVADLCFTGVSYVVYIASLIEHVLTFEEIQGDMLHLYLFVNRQYLHLKCFYISIFLLNIVLCHINRETYFGWVDLSFEPVRKQEFCATDSKMTSTFVHFIYKKKPSFKQMKKNTKELLMSNNINDF